MGASSVTGVSGLGSVAGSQKGSEHMSLGVHKLIGPRVCAAGSAVPGDVVFPALSGDVGDYVVMLTGDSAVATLTDALAAVSDSGDWGFTIGGSADLVNWLVVKTGL